MKALTRISSALLTALLFATAIVAVFGAPANVVYPIAGGLLTIGAVATAPQGSLFSLSVADIVSEYGQYYLDIPEHRSRLYTNLFQPSATPAFATPVMTNNTQWQGAEATISKIVQPFQKAWTAKGQAEFKPSTIQLRKFKIDNDFYPDDVEDTWLGFLAANQLNKEEWPLVRYIMEELFVKQKAEDMELGVYWKGEYVDPNEDGNVHPPKEAMDGLKKIIDDGVNAGTIQSVSLSAFNDSNALDNIETFVDAISERYQFTQMNVFVSHTNFVRYMRDKQNTHGGNPTYEKNSTKIDFTNFSLVSLPSMAGSDYVWATPKSNFVHVTKRSTDNFHVESEKRQVQVMTDWWEGLGFVIDQAVFAYAPGAAGGSASVSV